MNTRTLYFVYPGDLDTPTGGYRYDRRLIAELRARNLNVVTVALSASFPFPDKNAIEQASKTLAGLPDDSVVIIDGLAFGAMVDVAVAETDRLRLIALCHHPLALESGLDATQKQAFMDSEARALRCTRAVVVTSPHTGDIVRTQFGVPAERIVVALPGTDRVEFASCQGDPPVLLTVASLTPRKAHDLLIDALAPLQHLAWQARMVGGDSFDRPWAAALRERVNRLGLAGRIKFAGTAENLQAEYRAADVFVLPSRFEGYGMVFAEALASGLPIVATRAGAVPDVVPTTAGLLVPPDNIDALSDALRKVLSDENVRRQLQCGARSASAALPTWQQSGEQVAQLVKRVQLT